MNPVDELNIGEKSYSKLHHRHFYQVGQVNDTEVVDNDDNQSGKDNSKTIAKGERRSFERRSQSLDRQNQANNTGDKSDRDKKSHVSRNIKAVVSLLQSSSIGF